MGSNVLNKKDILYERFFPILRAFAFSREVDKLKPLYVLFIFFFRENCKNE